MKKLLLLLILVLSVISVSAQELELKYNIEYGKVLVNYKLTNTEEFNLELPKDYSAISYYINNKPSTPEILDNIITIPPGDIELSFLTKKPLESSGANTFFLKDLNLPKSFQSKITLTLPENAILSKPADQGSVYPSNAKITTDGQQITLEWETNLQKNKGFSIFVIFKESKTYWWILIPFILAIIVLIILLKKKPKIKRIIKKQPVKLKPEEQRIVNILNKKDGECEQATLRLITDHPKATLSRILKELEQRNIIKKVSKGKKNIIVLK